MDDDGNVADEEAGDVALLLPVASECRVPLDMRRRSGHQERAECGWCVWVAVALRGGGGCGSSLQARPTSRRRRRDEAKEQTTPREQSSSGGGGWHGCRCGAWAVGSTHSVVLRAEEGVCTECLHRASCDKKYFSCFCDAVYNIGHRPLDVSVHVTLADHCISLSTFGH